MVAQRRKHRAKLLSSMAMAATSSLCNVLSFTPPSSKTLISTLSSHSLSSSSLPSLSSSFSQAVSLSVTKRDGFAPFASISDDGGFFSSSPSTSSFGSSDLLAVTCPSLAYANTLFFKSAYNVQVVVDDNEPDERLLGRFRREVMRAGVIQECKRRRFHENKQEEKKRKTREAARRNRKRRPRPRFIPKTDGPEGSAKKNDDDEDNWEFPVDDQTF